MIEADILGDKEPNNRNRRAATAYLKKLWPGGVIPYIIAGSFASEYIQLNRKLASPALTMGR